MHNRIKIIFCLVLMLMQTQLAAAGGFGSLQIGREDLEQNYRTLTDKIHSQSSTKEKVDFFQKQEREFLAIFLKMKEEVRKNPSLANSPDFDYAFEVYDQYIPLKEIRLDSSGRLMKASCLEATSLASVKDRALSLDGDDPTQTASQAKSALDLIQNICGD